MQQRLEQNAAEAALARRLHGARGGTGEEFRSILGLRSSNVYHLLAPYLGAITTGRLTNQE